MSGLNQRFTKPSFLNWNREFESRSLRQQTPKGAFCLRREAKRSFAREIRTDVRSTNLAEFVAHLAPRIFSSDDEKKL